MATATAFRLHTTRGALHARRRWWSPAAACRSRAWAPAASATNWRASSATPCCRRAPGLVPLTLSGKHQERLAGSQRRRVAGRSAAATAQASSNYMLITHRGISGPAILQISSYWQPGDDLRLDLLPGTDALRRAAAAAGASARPRNSRPCSATLLPKRFAQRLCELWLPNRPMKQFNAPQLREIAQRRCSDWPLVASGTEGYRTAEVTLGGVDTDELSSSTMQSRRVPGPVFHRRGGRRHRLAGRLQLPVGLGVGPRGRQRGLSAANAFSASRSPRAAG